MPRLILSSLVLALSGAVATTAAASGAPEIMADMHRAQSLTYPVQARDAGIEGVVMLHVEVDISGRTTDIRAVGESAHPLLRQAAIDSVRRWRFAPATRDGEAISSILSIPIRFELLSGREHPDSGLGPASLKALW